MAQERKPSANMGDFSDTYRCQTRSEQLAGPVPGWAEVSCLPSKSPGEDKPAVGPLHTGQAESPQEDLVPAQQS